MRLVTLSGALLAIIDATATIAFGEQRDIRLEDFMETILADAWVAARLPGIELPDSRLLRAAPLVQPAARRPRMTILRFGAAIALNDEAADLLIAGALRAYTGFYEPRHLAAALADTALFAVERFARFNVEAKSWRRMLARM